MVNYLQLSAFCLFVCVFLFLLSLSCETGGNLKLTWTVMAVLPTPPSPRTVILKSIRAEGPFLFSFRFFGIKTKVGDCFFFFASQGCGCGDVDRDEGTHHLFEIGDYRGERNKGVGVG